MRKYRPYSTSQDKSANVCGGKVMEIVAAYRPKELKHFQAMEELATWRRTYGYDRDDSWMHGTRPLAPEEFTASLWEEVNALKEAISMSGRARPWQWQKTKEFLDGLEQGTTSLTDEELVMLKRIVERQSRDAACATAASIDTAQYCDPRPPSPEISSGTRICMEENEEDMMDPEQDQLESPSASTGFETPGQQYHPTWETGRTTAAGYLTAGMGSNLGGDTSSPTERVDTRAQSKITTAPTAPNTTFLQARRKPNDTKTLSEESKQFDPGGKGGEPAGVPKAFSFFWGKRWAWDARCLCFVFFVCVCLSVCLVSYY